MNKNNIKSLLKDINMLIPNEEISDIDVFTTILKNYVRIE